MLMRAHIDKGEERLWILKGMTKGIWDDHKRGKCYWVVRGREIDKSGDITEAKIRKEQNYKHKWNM